MISEASLDFWIKHGYNVMFKGRHGVGKTSIVKEAFDRAKLKWRYFSAATMDPWVDFIGVPKEQQNGHGSYLELVRPIEFQQDTVEAIFLDEFNRAHKKVRNAVMELIQFRSINGKKFNNLRMIWAAINPDEEEEYDVEVLDPAQRDRFPIQVELPYRPHLPYFIEVYGEETARGAVSWWQDLPDDQKDLVSPRRLDYALDVLSKGGNVRDVVPASANISNLLTTIKTGPVADRLQRFCDQSDEEGARKFLASENQYSAAIGYIVSKRTYLEFFVPLLGDEKISLLIATEKSVFDYAVQAARLDRRIRQIIADIIRADANKKLVRKLKKEFAGDPNAPALFGAGYLLPTGELIGDDTPENSYFKSQITSTTMVDNWHRRSNNISQTHDRRKLLEEIKDRMPCRLTTDEALKMLRVFSNIAARCQQKTMKGWGGSSFKWVGMVNHCVEQIHKNDNATWPEMVAAHKIDQMGIFAKLAEGGFGNKIYTPNRKLKVPAGQKQPNPLKGKKFSKTGNAPAVGKTCPNCQAIVGCRTKFCKCGHKFYGP